MNENLTRSPQSPESEAPLEGWKEIASYLKRDVTTAKRWEKNEGLPVRRHQHQARSSVYAYPSELDTWLATRQPTTELAASWYRRPASALAMAAALLLALASVASGPLVNPPGAAAEDGSGMLARQVWTGPEINFYGMVAPSPDGRYITFSDRGHLAVRDLLSGETRRLKSPSHPNEHAEFSIISPDGQQIAYEWENAEDFDELRLIAFDGSGDRLLYRNPETKSIRPYAWSPDGKTVFVVRRLRDQTWQIARVSISDGSLQVIRSLEWRYPNKLSLSPHGRYLVYDLLVRQDSPDRDIFLLAADGSREVQLIEHPAVDDFPVWTPDGKQIVFTSDRRGTWGLWSLTLGDENPQGPARLLKPDVGPILPFGFAGEGSYYYGAGMFDVDIYAAEIDRATGKVITSPTPLIRSYVGSNLAPAWSPDGRQLAYLSARGSVPFGPGWATIVVRSLETGQERAFTTDLDIEAPPQWFPDGRTLLIAAEDRRDRVSFYRLEVDTGQVELIHQNVTVELDRGPFPALTPDGKAIFYLHGDPDDEYRSLRLYEIESAQKKEIYRVAPPLHFTRLALSPDGQQVVFLLHDDATDARILQIVAVTGGEARELWRPNKPYHLSTNAGISWTPDGRYVLVLRHTGQPGHEHELWRVPTEGGEPERLGLTVERLGNPIVHPDGRQIVFSLGPLLVESGVWVLENFLPQAEVARAE